MDPGFLLQSGASAVAVTALVALAAWAKIDRRPPPLDEARARTLLADDFPDRTIEQVWVSADGAGAVAKAGDAGLVLVRVGDSYAARRIAWAEACSAAVCDGRVALDLGDVAAPRAVLRLAAWPPRELAA